jgi:type IV fimbrial biogenesis protein FimT
MKILGRTNNHCEPEAMFSEKRLNAGFTLVELMITVVLLAILTILAMPAFQGVMERLRIQSAANSLSAAFATARSESVKLGTNVTVCKSLDKENCTTDGDWSIGWIIHATAASPIKVFDSPAGGVSMAGSSVPDLQNSVQFMPTGASNLGATGNVTVCLPGRTSRVVSVASSGRIRVAEGGVCP